MYHSAQVCISFCPDDLRMVVVILGGIKEVWLLIFKGRLSFQAPFLVSDSNLVRSWSVLKPFVVPCRWFLVRPSFWFQVRLLFISGSKSELCRSSPLVLIKHLALSSLNPWLLGDIGSRVQCDFRLCTFIMDVGGRLWTPEVFRIDHEGDALNGRRVCLQPWGVGMWEENTDHRSGSPGEF